jgi:cell division protease FtsH
MNMDDNLFNLDYKMEKIKKEYNILRQQKNHLLGNKKGLKLNNSSNVEINEENDNDDQYYRNPFVSPLLDHPPYIRLFINNTNPNQHPNDQKKNSDNFQIVKNKNLNFTHIGGYSLIKEELMQCADILINHEKYSKFNIRVPRGLIFEGPPGNGKTLLAKCFSGEIDVNFIAVSGAEFQEKYVGVGASRVRELFELASKNKPCIIFIDEIDALGRKRSTDESSNTERDSTLNELLVALDGFKANDGIFIIGATNRLDLLDPALVRPGRIDKSITVGLPDTKTREAILNIHIKGKPYDNTVTIDNLIEMTQGLSGAQIENLLNEAMLYALRSNKEIITKNEIEYILNRILVGWQSTEIKYTDNFLYQIAVHEMGHAIVGLLSHDYNKLLKVTLNTWSPKTPGYTLFETKDTNLYTKQRLITHLMVLLGGRIAEEEFFGESISTGASKDLEEAKKMAENMILTFGMGTKMIYPHSSDNSKQIIDAEISELIDIAYVKAKLIICNSRKLIDECSNMLLEEHILMPEYILKKINTKYPYLLHILHKK